MHRDEAIIDAGQKRARPIIMTTIAMVAGMIPSALSFGAGGEIRSPMALAVIGGLMFSTVLSLIFVPAMFAVMDEFALLCWRYGKRFIGPDDAGRAKPRLRRHNRRPREAGHDSRILLNSRFDGSESGTAPGYGAVRIGT